MKFATALLFALVTIVAEAYSPMGAPKKATFDFKKAAVGAFVAASLASNIATAPPASASMMDNQFAGSGSFLVAERVVREGIYREYEIDLPDQQEVDDAKSTFKTAKETKSKKGKYTALLSILVVGSFIIPMAQYFWYVRDDDSSDRFFAEDVPEPPKKKGWF